MRKLLLIIVFCIISINVEASKGNKLEKLYKFLRTRDAVSQLDLTKLSGSGLMVRNVTSEGSMYVSATYRLKLPEYVKGIFYARDVRGRNNWPDGTNRLLPWYFGSDISELIDDQAKGIPSNGELCPFAFFISLELRNGKHIVLNSFASSSHMSWFTLSEKGELLLQVGTLGKKSCSGNLELFSYSVDKNVYDAFNKSWSKLIESEKINSDYRYKKRYPELFEYLGWCSWEQYKKRISEKLLVNDFKLIENSDIPVRYFLVDDGHLKFKNSRLQSFKPDVKKFPNEWENLIKLKNKDKIKWIGLWNNFNGYWGSISEDNDFGDELNSHLTKLPSGAIMPKGKYESAKAFYDAYIGTSAKYGFDYVKIDNQSSALFHYIGDENPTEYAQNCNIALENACKKNGLGLINCMAHNTVNFYNTKYSAVTRVSIDYKLNNADKAKSHIFQSYTNSLWMGQTVWPDHDMFHSSDKFCGRLMAVSKAMSGAPVYLSDAPADFDKKLILPLCYEDGKLIRPLAPAIPTKESVEIEPFHYNNSYRVFAPTGNNAVSVVCYNLTTGKKRSVKSFISKDDLKPANALIQDKSKMYNNNSVENAIAYDYYNQKVIDLNSDYKFTIYGFNDRLFHIYPNKIGCVFIGLTDKYLSPGTYKIVKQRAGRVVVKLHEAREFAVWVKSGKPKAKGFRFEEKGNGLWVCKNLNGRKKVDIRF